MLKLVAPADYFNLTPEEKDEICNGAGPAHFGWLVPDTMYGLDISEAANIHDYQYNIGKTLEDKKEADTNFLTNMRRIINNHNGYGWVNWLRKRRALKYYYAVKTCGESAFMANK